jgi:hypothetical protein
VNTYTFHGCVLVPDHEILRQRRGCVRSSRSHRLVEKGADRAARRDRGIDRFPGWTADHGELAMTTKATPVTATII